MQYFNTSGLLECLIPLTHIYAFVTVDRLMFISLNAHFKQVTCRYLETTLIESEKQIRRFSSSELSNIGHDLHSAHLTTAFFKMYQIISLRMRVNRISLSSPQDRMWSSPPFHVHFASVPQEKF